jgi:hypothetical protein
VVAEDATIDTKETMTVMAEAEEVVAVLAGAVVAVVEGGREDLGPGLRSTLIAFVFSFKLILKFKMLFYNYVGT